MPTTNTTDTPTYHLQFEDPGLWYKAELFARTAEQVFPRIDTETNFSEVIVSDTVTKRVVQIYRRNESTDWTWRPVMPHGTQFSTSNTQTP